MSTICKIIRACSIVSIFNRPPVLNRIVKLHKKSFNFCESYVGFVDVRKMSQKSITSFFKKTPKKAVEVKDEPPVEDDTVASSAGEESPVKNQKRSSKRQRLDSSDEESATSPTTNTNSDKNKIVKRQRIDSSGSESAKSEDGSDMVMTKNNGPIKTYSSPRSKKLRKSPEEGKPDSPETKVKVKEEKTTPESRRKKSPVQKNPKSGKKSSAVENGVANGTREKTPPKKVKEEKVSPKSVKDSKSDKDSKKDKDSKVENKTEGEAKEKGALVAESDYNPAKAKYHPVDDACWAAGQPVPYLALAKTLEAIEATSARLKMIDILANYFRSVMVLTPEDLLPSMYMCLNQLAPAYHSLELGIAETYLMKAIGQCTGRTLAQVKAAARAGGDLGALAEAARAGQRTMFPAPPLTARHVFQACRDIARMTGQASVTKKIAKIQSLYVASRQCEARYLVRSLEGKLRVGLAEQSALQALAVAAARTPPPCPPQLLDASRGLTPEEFKSRVDENALIIKTTYCECPDYERVLPALLQHGVRQLPAHCPLQPGTPLKPMLAHPTKGVSEIFDRFEGQEFTCEWKYDGERAQIHVPRAESAGAEDVPRADLARARVFSRNQEDNTSKYPDVLGRLSSLLKDSVTSCVLDCEAVAYDTEKQQILPFQILSTRKRKDASAADIKVQVCVFVFDALFLNDAPLVARPLQERRALLREHFNEVPGSWQFATSADCSSVEEVQQFLERAVRGSCEGLMVKMLRGPHARYDIARRSHNWLKLKKDYLEGVGDTIDAVVVGAYHGRGRRAGLWGGFLLACYDADHDRYQTLCKLGTGFSDEDLKRLTEKLQEHVIDTPKSYYSFDPSQSPDVWLAAAAVWELRCADLSLSPAHRAALGLVQHDKGVSLRFPRFLRERDDKTPEQATSAAQIASMYLAQDLVRNSGGDKLKANDDFY